MNPFVEQHRDKIGCVLSSFDRVVIMGTLPDIDYPNAMSGYLSYREISAIAMGPASLKLNDKAGLIARVEGTANDKRVQ